VRHRGSMHGSVHVHIADSVRAKLAVRLTARFADPRPFRPVTRAPDCSPDGYMPCIRPAVLRRPARATRRAGLARTPGGRGRLPDRPAPSHQGCHAGGDQVRVARRRAEPWHGCRGERSCGGSGAAQYERRHHAARVGIIARAEEATPAAWRPVPGCRLSGGHYPSSPPVSATGTR
jgi:hypothetical protein